MASVQKVQSYLSYWLQLGKPVVFDKTQTEYLPQPIYQGSEYSRAFGDCWQQVMQNPKGYHLRGTDESFAELLSDEWDIVGCARCPMPIPMPVRGLSVSPCPCADLPLWPNSEVPQPREGVCTNMRLNSIKQRLDDRAQESRDRLQSAYQNSPELPKRILDAAETIE